jgi:iron complex outermembrane recepter protein
MPLAAILVSASLAGLRLVAQPSDSPSAQRIAPATKAAGDEEKIQLSPFTVNADKDVGYLAGNTLAGSRLNTSLKDTAASISVFTEEFISDLAATDLTTLTNYANNVELELADSQNNTAPNGNNLLEFYQTYRVRGLPASVARNYFNWKLPTDTYNIGRVEDSRGANAVLFGVGSAGGVLNSSTKQPILGRSHYRLTGSIGSFDSHRGTVDFNQAMLRGKFGVRVNAVYDQSNNFRRYAFSEGRRVHLSTRWQINERTAVRAEGEVGHIDDNTARTYNLTNNYGNWLSTGRPTVAAPVATNGAQGLLRLATTARITYVANNDSLMNWANTMSTSGNSAIVTDPALTDRSINVSGPGALRKANFDTYSAYLEHRLGPKTFIEGAFNHQFYHFDSYDSTVTGTNLTGDPNRLLPTGAANPYAGRFMLESSWFRRERAEKSNTFRLTFATEFDAGKLGNYRLALLGEHERRNFKSNEYGEVIEGRPFNVAPENAANNLFRRSYVTEGDWASYYLNGAHTFGLVRNRVDPVTGRTFSSTWVQRNNSPEDDPSTQRSLLLGGQARYFGGRIVAGVGFRRDLGTINDRAALRDRATNIFVVDYNNTTVNKFTGDTRTLGVVGHVTPWLSVLANLANNVDLPNPRITIVPNTRPSPPEGEGRDIGLALTLLDGKIYARAVYYEAESKGQMDFRLQNVGNTNARVLDALRNANLITQGEVERRTVTANGATFDRKSDGYEFQVTGNPTRNWRLLANFSIAHATEDNIAPEVKAWAADNLPFWSRFNQNLVTSGAATLASEQATLRSALDELFDTEGAGQLGNREYKVNAFTRYGFTQGLVRGVFVGGGYRHQSKMLVGRDAATGEKIYGNSYWQADALLGYNVRGLPRNATLSLQLNVSNVFDRTDPLIVRFQGAAAVRRYILVPPRTWRLTANLGF